MDFFEDQNRTGNDIHETVYHTGNGFYNPYVEPLWKKERRMLRKAGNEIGLATLFYYLFSSLGAAVLLLFVELFYPYANIRGSLYLTETVELLFSLISYVLALAIPFFFYVLFTRIPFRVAFPFRRSKIDLTVGGIFIGVACTVLAGYAANYLEIFLSSFGIYSSAPESIIPETLPGLIIYFLSMAVVPAFVEEMVFRGVIMQSLRRFGDLFALIVSSVIFAALHLDIFQGVYCFISGICIGYFVMRTGSLWVGIIIHFINNAASVFFQLFVNDLSYESQYILNSLYNLLFVILAVISLVFILIKYKDIFRFEPSRISLTPGKRTVCFLTSPILLFAAVLTVLMSFQFISIF